MSKVGQSSGSSSSASKTSKPSKDWKSKDTYVSTILPISARTISYRWAVTGTPETHHGDVKAVSFKEKIHGNSSKSGNKTPSVSKAKSVLCQFCGKNNHPNADCHTRTSEFTNNQNRPYVGSEAHGRLVKATGDRDWIPNFK